MGNHCNTCISREPELKKIDFSLRNNGKSSNTKSLKRGRKKYPSIKVKKLNSDSNSDENTNQKTGKSHSFSERNEEIIGLVGVTEGRGVLESDEEEEDVFYEISSKILSVQKYSVGDTHITMDNLIKTIRKILSETPSSKKRIEYLSRCFYKTCEQEKKEKKKGLLPRRDMLIFQYLKESFIHQLIFFFFNEITSFDYFIKKHTNEDFFNHIYDLIKSGSETWIICLFDFLTNMEENIHYSYDTALRIFEPFFLKLHSNMNEFSDKSSNKSNCIFTSDEIQHHLHLLKLSSQFPVLKRIILESKKLMFTMNDHDDQKFNDPLFFLRHSFLGPFFRISLRNGKLSRSFKVKERIERNVLRITQDTSSSSRIIVSDESYLEMKRFMYRSRRLLGKICRNFTMSSTRSFSSLLNWFERGFSHLVYHIDRLLKNSMLNSQNWPLVSFNDEIIGELKGFGYNLSIIFTQYVFLEQTDSYGLNKIAMIDPIIGYQNYVHENFISVTRLSGSEIRKFIVEELTFKNSVKRGVLKRSEDIMKLKHGRPGIAVVSSQSHTLHHNNINIPTRLYFLMMRMMNERIVPELLKISRSRDRLELIQMYSQFPKIQVNNVTLAKKNSILYELVTDRVDVFGGNVESFVRCLIRCQMFNLNTLMYYMKNILPQRTSPVKKQDDDDNNNIEEEEEETEEEIDQIPMSYACIPEYFLTDFFKIFTHVHKVLTPEVTDKIFSDEDVFDMPRFVKLIFFLVNKPQYYRNIESYEVIKSIIQVFPSSEYNNNNNKAITRRRRRRWSGDNIDIIFQFQERFLRNISVRDNFIRTLVHFFVHMKLDDWQRALIAQLPTNQILDLMKEMFDVRNEVCKIFHKIMTIQKQQQQEPSSDNSAYHKFYSDFRNEMRNSMETRVSVLSILLNETLKYSLQSVLKSETEIRMEYQRNMGVIRHLSTRFRKDNQSSVNYNSSRFSELEIQSHRLYVSLSKKNLEDLYGLQRSFLARISVLSELISIVSDQLDAVFCNQIAQFVCKCVVKILSSQPVQCYPFYEGMSTYLLRDEFMFTLAEIMIHVSCQTNCDEEFFYGLVTFPDFKKEMLTMKLRKTLESRVDEEKKLNKSGKKKKKNWYLDIFRRYDLFLKDLEEYCSDDEDGREKQKKDDDDDDPEEFCCGLTYVLMNDPVTWKGSSVVVERSAIMRCLLEKKEDPFTRKKLTKRMLRSLPDLKKRIMEYRKRVGRLKKKKREKKEEHEEEEEVVL